MLLTLLEFILSYILKHLLTRFLPGENMVKGNLCLTKGCKNRKSDFKGLCMICYKSAKQLVERGTTTWQELGKMGLAEVESNLFLDNFNRKKKQNASHKQTQSESEEE